MRNPYIFMFGFEQKADSIPLTARSSRGTS